MKLALMAAAAASLVVTGMAPPAQAQWRHFRHFDPFEDIEDYVFNGHQYCWYDDGWNGPGWYWCDYAWYRGYGWGGGEGWRGWDRDRWERGHGREFRGERDHDFDRDREHHEHDHDRGHDRDHDRDRF